MIAAKSGMRAKVVRRDSIGHVHVDMKDAPPGQVKIQIDPLAVLLGGKGLLALCHHLACRIVTTYAASSSRRFVHVLEM